MWDRRKLCVLSQPQSTITEYWKEKEMLPYQGDMKLEELLESLFNDAISEGIVVWNGSGKRRIFTDCCTYNYTDYGG